MSSHNWICQFYWKTFLHSPFYYSFYVIVDAGVLFEVLCAINKTGKVERVAPPPKVSIDLWFYFFILLCRMGICDIDFLSAIVSWRLDSNEFCVFGLLWLLEMSRRRQKFMLLLTFFHTIMPRFLSLLCSLKRLSLLL